jgi:hypothetical protein
LLREFGDPWDQRLIVGITYRAGSTCTDEQRQWLVVRSEVLTELLDLAARVMS